MENSENKSIINTGSSNLSKTEKLLSITQKILSEIKPKYESVKIGTQEWMTRNLDVDRFRNGDLIPHIESDEEWVKAGKNGQPALCYYDNDPDNGKKYGKLYNWHAVNDPRGLAPEGWHVPSDHEWTILMENFYCDEIAGLNLKSVEGWEGWESKDGKIQNGNGDNSSGFNGLPGGLLDYDGSFDGIRNFAFFWCATEFHNYDAYYRILGNSIFTEYKGGRLYYVNKSVGASVRCLRDD